MKIIDWKLINHAINVGDAVVIQKHISGKKSMFYWRTLAYAGLTSPNVAKFKMKHRLSVRWDGRRENYNPRMHYPVSFPLGICWQFNDTQGNNVDQVMPTIDFLWSERFANESYMDITPHSEDKDVILLDIEIPLTEFAFIKESEFNDFVERQQIKQFLIDNSWLDIYMPTAKKLQASNGVVWWRQSVVELEQIIKEVISVSVGIGPMSNYTQLSVIYRLRNTNLWNIDRSAEWHPFPMNYCRWEAPHWRFTSQELCFDTHNNPNYDEYLVNVGQIINFAYRQEHEEVPTDFFVGSSARASSEEIEYISQWATYIMLSAREHQSRAAAPDFPRWRTVSDRDTRETAEYFLTTYWLWDVVEGQAPNRISQVAYNNTAQMLRYMQQLRPQPVKQPGGEDLKVWDIVYIKPEALGNKFHRKNREYTVLSYWGNDGWNNEVYRIQPTNKKSFNWEWAIEMRSIHLFKAEKIAKRKFILERDFWKYKAGQSFSKEELIQIFGKFQDARDPFILNKLYICAE